MTYAGVVAVGCMVLVHCGAPRAVQARPQDAGPPIERCLRAIGLSATQRDSISRGQVVVQLLPGGTDRDVAVVGIVGVSGASEAVRARALDVEGLLDEAGGRFQLMADPATAADVRDAALDESEYRDLRDCRPGACDFKLPASAMESFLEQVDWSAPNAKAQAEELVRAGLLRLAADYRARGNAATPPYDDLRGVRSGDVFAELLRDSPLVHAYTPELQRYLLAYPSGRPPGTREILYWSEDRLPHLRPLLTLNHVVVYVSPAGSALVARKQIYASHYFEGGFELLAVIDAGADAAVDTTYLLALRRFRFDSLPGGPANIKGRVQRQLVDATRADLRRAAATMKAPAS